jgi:hypothetical protein
MLRAIAPHLCRSASRRIESELENGRATNTPAIVEEQEMPVAQDMVSVVDLPRSR